MALDVGTSYGSLCQKAEFSRKKADKAGNHTYGELSRMWGYNVVALASRFSNGWMYDEVKAGKREGIEIARTVVFDQKGISFVNAGSFCTKYGMCLNDLVKAVETIKTNDEYLRILFELRNKDKLLNNNYVGLDGIVKSVSTESTRAQVSDKKHDYIYELATAPFDVDIPEELKEAVELEKERLAKKQTEAERSVSEFRQELDKAVELEVKMPSVGYDKPMTIDIEPEVPQVELSLVQEKPLLLKEEIAKRLRKNLYREHSNLGVVDSTGTVTDLKEFASSKGVTEDDFVAFIKSGFLCSDIAVNGYYAKSCDTGILDFPQGIDGMSVADFCKQNGITVAYLLTKYRRNTSRTKSNTPESIVAEYHNKGITDFTAEWSCSIIEKADNL